MICNEADQLGTWDENLESSDGGNMTGPSIHLTAAHQHQNGCDKKVFMNSQSDLPVSQRVGATLQSAISDVSFPLSVTSLATASQGDTTVHTKRLNIVLGDTNLSKNNTKLESLIPNDFSVRKKQNSSNVEPNLLLYKKKNEFSEDAGYLSEERFPWSPRASSSHIEAQSDEDISEHPSDGAVVHEDEPLSYKSFNSTKALPFVRTTALPTSRMRSIPSKWHVPKIRDNDRPNERLRRLHQFSKFVAELSDVHDVTDQPPVAWDSNEKQRKGHLCASDSQQASKDTKLPSMRSFGGAFEWCQDSSQIVRNAVNNLPRIAEENASQSSPQFSSLTPAKDAEKSKSPSRSTSIDSKIYLPHAEPQMGHESSRKSACRYSDKCIESSTTSGHSPILKNQNADSSKNNNSHGLVPRANTCRDMKREICIKSASNLVLSPSQFRNISSPPSNTKVESSSVPAKVSMMSNNKFEDKNGLYDFLNKKSHLTYNTSCMAFPPQQQQQQQQQPSLMNRDVISSDYGNLSQQINQAEIENLRNEMRDLKESLSTLQIALSCRSDNQSSHLSQMSSPNQRFQCAAKNSDNKPFVTCEPKPQPRPELPKSIEEALSRQSYSIPLPLFQTGRRHSSERQFNHASTQILEPAMQVVAPIDQNEMSTDRYPSRQMSTESCQNTKAHTAMKCDDNDFYVGDIAALQAALAECNRHLTIQMITGMKQRFLLKSFIAKIECKEKTKISLDKDGFPVEHFSEEKLKTCEETLKFLEQQLIEKNKLEASLHKEILKLNNQNIKLQREMRHLDLIKSTYHLTPSQQRFLALREALSEMSTNVATLRSNFKSKCLECQTLQSEVQFLRESVVNRSSNCFGDLSVGRLAQPQQTAEGADSKLVETPSTTISQSEPQSLVADDETKRLAESPCNMLHRKIQTNAQVRSKEACSTTAALDDKSLRRETRPVVQPPKFIKLPPPPNILQIAGVSQKVTANRVGIDTIKELQTKVFEKKKIARHVSVNGSVDRSQLILDDAIEAQTSKPENNAILTPILSPLVRGRPAVSYTKKIVQMSSKAPTTADHQKKPRKKKVALSSRKKRTTSDNETDVRRAARESKNAMSFSVLAVNGETVYEPALNDRIDRVVAKFTNSRSNRILFTRVKEGFYLFGRLPVTLTLNTEDSSMVEVHFNDNKMPLQGFVEAFEDTEFSILDAKAHQEIPSVDHSNFKEKPLNVTGSPFNNEWGGTNTLKPLRADKNLRARRSPTKAEDSLSQVVEKEVSRHVDLKKSVLTGTKVTTKTKYRSSSSSEKYECLERLPNSDVLPTTTGIARPRTKNKSSSPVTSTRCQPEAPTSSSPKVRRQAKSVDNSRLACATERLIYRLEQGQKVGRILKSPNNLHKISTSDLYRRVSNLSRIEKSESDLTLLGAKSRNDKIFKNEALPVAVQSPKDIKVVKKKKVTSKVTSDEVKRESQFLVERRFIPAHRANHLFIEQNDNSRQVTAYDVQHTPLGSFDGNTLQQDTKGIYPHTGVKVRQQSLLDTQQAFSPGGGQCIEAMHVDYPPSTGRPTLPNDIKTVFSVQKQCIQDTAPLYSPTRYHTQRERKLVELPSKIPQNIGGHDVVNGSISQRSPGAIMSSELCYFNGPHVDQNKATNAATWRYHLPLNQKLATSPQHSALGILDDIKQTCDVQPTTKKQKSPELKLVSAPIYRLHSVDPNTQRYTAVGTPNHSFSRAQSMAGRFRNGIGVPGALSGEMLTPVSQTPQPTTVMHSPQQPTAQHSLCANNHLSVNPVVPAFVQWSNGQITSISPVQTDLYS